MTFQVLKFGTILYIYHEHAVKNYNYLLLSHNMFEYNVKPRFPQPQPKMYWRYPRSDILFYHNNKCGRMQPTFTFRSVCVNGLIFRPAWKFFTNFYYCSQVMIKSIFLLQKPCLRMNHSQKSSFHYNKY